MDGQMDRQTAYYRDSRMHLKIIRDNLTKKAAKTLVASFGIIYATAGVIDTTFFSYCSRNLTNIHQKHVCYEKYQIMN